MVTAWNRITLMGSHFVKLIPAIVFGCGVALFFAVNFWFRRRSFQAHAKGLFPLGKGSIDDVKRLVESGQRDLAIYLYRNLFRVDLATAKNHIELLAAGQPLPPLPTLSESTEHAPDTTLLSPQQLAQIRSHLLSGEKIEAIKLYRKALKTDLTAARSAIESIENEHFAAGTKAASSSKDVSK